MTPTPPFELERWRVEPDRNALISGDGEIRLGSRVMAVLLVLVKSGGRVVSRQELLEEAWEGRAVTDDALTVAIHDLRKALGDRPSAPRFIETIPGRGYRWLAPVKAAAETSLSSPPSPSPSPPSSTSPSAGDAKAARRSWRAVAGVLAVLLAAVLAVLAGVLVSAWWRAGEARGTAGEGEATVRVEAGRINPEIPRAAGDAYDRGLVAADTLEPEGFREAAVHFEEAARLAPEFAMAHVSLADALLNLSYFPSTDFPSTERPALVRRARAEARQALALDPTLPSAHLLQGVIRMYVDFDLEAAEKNFWQAIQLDPGHAPAHERYAGVLVAQGRFAAAEVRLRHATELAPDHRRFAMTLGQLLVILRRPEEALEVLAGEGWEPPMLHHALIYRSRALAALGREAEACATELDFLRRALPSLDLEPYRRACSRGGLPGLHALWLENLEGSTNLFLRAAFLLELGRRGEALATLWQMHRERDPLLLGVPNDPAFEDLAGHPDFDRLLDSMGPFDPDDPPAVSATCHPSWAVRAP